MNKKIKVLIESLAYFLGAGLAMYFAVHTVIPYLKDQYAVPPLFGWWLTSGVIMAFLFFSAIESASRKSKRKSFKEIAKALRLNPLNLEDIIWTVAGLSAILVLTGTVAWFFSQFLSINLLSQESYSSFLKMEKLKPGEYLLLLAWLPYFFFNIFGEELMWRGCLLPKQTDAFGRYAWALNGSLWAIFHFGIGWRLAILLLPIEFTVPFVVQKRQNTWLGIIIHGLYNGSGFLMVALGIVS